MLAEKKFHQLDFIKKRNTISVGNMKSNAEGFSISKGYVHKHLNAPNCRGQVQKNIDGAW